MYYKVLILKLTAFLILFISHAQALESLDNKVKIIALLPFTGKDAVIGENIFNGMKLALKDLEDENIKLVPLDSGQSEVFIENFIIKHNPKIILGPLYSKDVKKLLPLINQSKKCFISFSNDKGLINNSLLLFGIMPDQSIKQMLALQDFKDYNIIAYLPDSEFGKFINDELKLLNDSHQIVLNNISFYKSLENILELHKKKLFEVNKKYTLVIPEISAFKELSKHFNLKEFKIILGNQLYDEKLFANLKLNNIFFASLSKKYNDKFQQRFEDEFKARPIPIASLSYELIALIHSLMKNNQSLTLNNLITSHWFKGINGEFKFESSGENLRKFSIYKFNNGIIEEINY